MSDEGKKAVELPVVGGGPGGERCDRCYYARTATDEDHVVCWRNPPRPNPLHGLAVLLNARD
jgi:hypothetical protein